MSRTIMPVCTSGAASRASLVLLVSIVLGFASVLGGAALPAAASAPERALVIVGGGALPDAVRDEFVCLAGGRSKARLVVIPTASALAHATRVFRSFDYWKAQGLASVRLLHTVDRRQADDPEFVKPLTEATAVWLGGGAQDRLLEAYRGTLVERELHKLLARGGVIGGTSAGAAAISGCMIVGGNPLAEVARGFGLLPEAVIDQHFHNRNRLARLLGVLARYPEYLGLGVDEETAIVIRGHVGTVVGRAEVSLCLPPEGGQPPRVRVLKPGEVIDLRSLGHPPRPRWEPELAEQRGKRP